MNIGTYITYILVFAGAIITGSKSLEINFRLGRFTISSTYISLGILFVFSSIRYDVGTDYLNYVSAINWIDSGPFFYHKSPLFHYFYKAILWLDIPYYWFFVVTSFFINALVYRALNKYLKDKFLLGLMIYLLSGLYFYSFNAVRAILAFSILLNGAGYITKRKFAPYLILTLLASLVHFFSLFMIPVYFLIHRRISVVFAVLSFIVVAFIYMYSDKILGGLRYLVEQISYFEVYADGKYLQPVKTRTGLGILFTLLTLIYIYWVYYASKIPKEHLVYYNFFILGLLFRIISVKFLLFIRVQDFFYYYIIIALPLSFYQLQRKSRYIAALGFMTIFTALVFKTTLDPNRKLIPFKTIFTEYNQETVKQILYSDEYSRE